MKAGAVIELAPETENVDVGAMLPTPNLLFVLSITATWVPLEF